MSLFQTIKNLDKKFSWSFWGFVLAVIFGAITIHDKFIADTHPQFYLDILTNTAVLDIKEDLPKLDILYDKIDIRKQQMSLSVVAVKIVNDSSLDVLKSYYDSDDPFGMQINEGRIIKAELTKVTNEYLKKNLTVTAVSTNTLLFKPVVMEANNFFIVKLLVLHPAKTALSIQSVGHVAGMATIPTREIYKDTDKESIFTSSFKGSWEVQLLRLPAYSLLGIIAMIIAVILVALPFSEINAKFEKRKRSTIVSAFRNTIKGTYTEKDEFILNVYKERGVEYINAIHILLSDKPQIDLYCKKYAKKKTSSHVTQAEMTIYKDVHRLSEEMEFMALLVPPSLFHELLDNEIITKQDKHCIVDKNCLENLRHFIKYLKSRHLFPEPKLKEGMIIDEANSENNDSESA